MKTIIEMAREAGLHRTQHNLMSNPVQYRFSYDGYEENLERFAALVAEAATEAANVRANKSWALMCKKMVAAENEACAKVCDEVAESRGDADECATEIRARGNT